MTHDAVFINGTCRQLLFSPQGDIEGVIVIENGKSVQVSMTPETGGVFARVATPGCWVSVLAHADRSPKTAAGSHPVYRFAAFADGKGKALAPADKDAESTTIKGVVASLHFARHGQPNGVMLETGEFIHLRPQAMARAALRIGDRVSAVGDARWTVLGNRLLEARRINGADLH